MLLPLATALLLRQGKASFSTVGPLTSLMPQGKAAAPVSEGLSFAVTLFEGSKTISDGSFDLKVPETDGTVHVSLDGLAFTVGVLSGKANVSDAGRTPLEGLRVDLAADGTVIALTSGSILHVSLGGKTAKRIVAGPGIKPGQVENASTFDSPRRERSLPRRAKATSQSSRCGSRNSTARDGRSVCSGEAGSRRCRAPTR